MLCMHYYLFYWSDSNSSLIDCRPSIILINLILWILELIPSSVSSISSSNSERSDPVMLSSINLCLYILRPSLSSSWST